MARLIQICKFSVLFLAVLFAIVLAGINLPFTHKLVTNRANHFFQDREWPMHVGSLSFFVNGRIALQEPEIVPGTDTIVFARELVISVRPLPLLFKKVVVRNITLEDAMVNLSTDEATGEMNLVSLLQPEDINRTGNAGNSSRKNKWDIDINRIQLSGVALKFNDARHGMSVGLSVGSIGMRLGDFSLTGREVSVRDLELEDITAGMVVTPVPAEKEPESGDTPVWTFSLKDASLADVSFSLDQPAYKKRTIYTLDRGNISESHIDMGKRMLSFQSVDLTGPGLYLEGTEDTAAVHKGVPVPDPSTPEPSTPEPPLPDAFDPLSLWNIAGGTINITGASLVRGEYGVGGPQEFQNDGLLPVKAFNTSIENIRLDDAVAGFTVSGLSFALGNGMNLQEGRLSLRSDSALHTRLEVDLHTRSSKVSFGVASTLQLQEVLGTSISSAPFSMDINPSEIALSELYGLLPGIRDSLAHPAGENDRIRLEGHFQGSSDSMIIKDFNLSLPEYMGLHVNGYLTDLTELPSSRLSIGIYSDTLTHDGLTGLMRLAGMTGELPYFEPALLRAGIHEGIFTPAFGLSVSGNSGNVWLDGALDLYARNYRAEMDFADVNLGDMAEISDLERFSGNISLEGNGFEPDSIVASLMMNIDRLAYKGHNYDTLRVEANADKGTADFSAESRDASFRFNITGEGYLHDSLMQASLAGSFGINPGQLNLYPDDILFSGGIEASFETGPGNANGSLGIRDLVLEKADGSENAGTMAFSFESSGDLTSAKGDASFLQLAFESPSGAGEFFRNLTTLSDAERTAITDSVLAGHIPFVDRMPEFSLKAMATRQPWMNDFVPDSILNFNKISINVNKDPANDALTAMASADRYRYRDYSGYGTEVRLYALPDTISFALRSDSISAAAVTWASTRIEAHAGRGTAELELEVQDRHENVLYDLAAETALQDSTIVFTSADPQWILNGHPWTVNPLTVLAFEKVSGSIRPDLHLRSDASAVDLYGNSRETLFLDMKRLLLSKLVNPGITSHDFDGVVDGNATYSDVEGKKAGLQLDLTEIRWPDVPLESIGISGSFDSDTNGHAESNLYATINDSAQVNLVFRSGGEAGSRTLITDFTGLPLALAEPFVSDYVSGMKGYVGGHFDLTEGDLARPKLNGAIAFDRTSMTVIPLNAWFTLESDSLALNDDQLVIRAFSVRDTLGNPLQVNGTADLKDPGNITADLRIRSDGLRVMNTTASDNPTFYGSVIIDSELKITGPVQDPSIGGNLTLAGGTVINYQHSDVLKVAAAEQYVNFTSKAEKGSNPTGSVARNAGQAEGMADTSAGQATGTAPARSSDTSVTSATGTALEASIEIDPKTVFNFRIAGGYDVAMQITGGGYLSYVRMPDNQTSLTGTYEIRQGNASLKVTGWPEKNLAIVPGSNVIWNGQMDDPVLNIEATSSVSGSYINPVDNVSRATEFVVSMTLQNSLSQVNIDFDVRSDNQYVASVLNTLSENERMRQAINLLIFGKIDLPGMTNVSADVGDQISNFWATQINRFTESAFENVDLRVGLEGLSEQLVNGSGSASLGMNYELRTSLLQNRASLTVSGQFEDISPSGAGTSNIIENFEIEYALDSNRTTFIKVYHQQSSEDIFEKAVTKSGIGFIYRQRYRGFRDIWRKQETMTDMSE